ncbi:SUKH-4 family immunity protein [Streptomyces sp. NPDC001941]|uniref:SUKH-4 family immunity protein n=1 Tax=Streptomyces sp. NPDC001941 TaxID=3154659 RepID=UPI003326465C
MVTFAQAQERAEEWVNGDVPQYQHREVRVREFELGFVVWAEDREDGPTSDGGRQRLVIARDSGEATLWPALPVGEVIRRYEEEYGMPDEAPEPAAAPRRIDLNQTSFLLSPPEWLQDAADRMGIPDGPAGGSGGRDDAPGAGAGAPSAPVPSGATSGGGTGSHVGGQAWPGAAAAAAPEPPAGPGSGSASWPSAQGAQAAQPAWNDTSAGAGDEGSVGLPATVFAPPLSGADDDDEPEPAVGADAPTALMSGGSQLPKTALAPALRPEEPEPSGPAAPASPPPGAPGAAGGYVPTQLVSQLGPDGPQVPGAPSAPGAPGAPAGPGTPAGGVHHAATMLAQPGPAGPGAVQPPVAPGPVPMAPAGAPPAYGYPQQPPAGVPTVGPGYQAVLRYRAPDGSEAQIIRRSAPGTPHPEWQILHELRAMNVPPQQVLELHTELESCELPGGYCARMIRETWPQARITSIAPYGRDHASRQQGMAQLVAHHGELHQVADGPARPAPVRAPLPQVQPVPPVPPEAIAQELADTFGPGVMRFDQRAVSRQGVPEVVARTLVWAGLPADFGPFFWAQPPHPVVPTLAELAAQRQVQPSSDAGAYLVVGSDFGRAICVQYGTAHIVAVPVEGGPGGQPVAPQFVNSGLPEFTRCLAMLGRMWRLRFGLNPEQAGRWTVDFQAQLAMLDPAALASPESWWSVLLEQMWDGLL